MTKYIYALILIFFSFSAFADNYSDAWKGYHSGKYDEALQSFSDLAREGNVYAQVIVGIQHAAEYRYADIKESSPYNPSAVLSKITDMHNSGDIEATFLLALMHDEGWAAIKNDDLSKNFIMIAAKAGNTAAQAHLAEYYELGADREHGVKKAIYWYKKAAESGSIWAKQKLNLLSK
ncbi:hypothetical protein MNBD_GAMMA15-986 [hydrothermal vent metagenome]|uniref:TETRATRICOPEPTIDE REPEAT FAMILY PROTEIN n=2 Tax=hydrothermal vent metagenome TaxID=652676 RepID=A0A3B0YDH2_9ZZZZ